MKFLRIAALLLTCLCLLPACTNDEQPDIEMPETHAGAIDPNSLTSARVVHYNRAGEVDMDQPIGEDSPFLPLLATVYDRATETDRIGERMKLFEVTLESKSGTIALTVYSDMTMDQANGPTLTGQDMNDFLNAFMPIPKEETAA